MGKNLADTTFKVPIHKKVLLLAGTNATEFDPKKR